jgi:Skp family chaperone for outer membrane proteins
MPTSDADLARQQAEVEKLRQQVTEAERGLVSAQQELANDVTANALEKEKNALQARLAELKGASTKTAVKEGAAVVLDPDGTVAAHEEAKQSALAEAGELPAPEDVAPASPTSRKGGSR